MVEIDSPYKKHLLLILQKKYPFIKDVMVDLTEMTFSVYADIIIVIDCEKFISYFNLENLEKHFDHSFINKIINNFHFAVGISSPLDEVKKLEKVGDKIKRNAFSLAQSFFLYSDKEYKKKFRPRELQIFNLKWYFDCDNKY